MSASLVDMPPLAQALADAFANVEEAFHNACVHPLSSRKTLLVAVLIDNFCDQAFALLRRIAPAQVLYTDDVLAFRECLGAKAPSLRLIFDLCALAPGGPRLETRATAVPIEAYGNLSIEDFMVSLYNASTVQRVMIVADGGLMRQAHEVLREAIAHLKSAVLLTAS